MSDDFAAARGCVHGALISLALWAAIAGGIAICIGCWQVIP